MVHDVPDRPLADAVLMSQRGLLTESPGVLCADFVNLGFRQFVSGNIFALHGEWTFHPPMFGFNALVSFCKALRWSISSSPSVISQYLPNGSLAYPELNGQSVLLPHRARVTSANFFDFNPSKFVLRLVFAAIRSVVRAYGKTVRPLLLHVSRIIEGCPKVKVLGIYAPRDVAAWTTMEHEQSRFDSSIVKQPRSTVRINQSPVFSAFIDRALPNGSMACGHSSQAIPEPMGRRDKDTLPKALGECRRKSLFAEEVRTNVKLWSKHTLFHRLRAVTGRAGALLNSIGMNGASQSQC